jgi:hypothetical protein
MLEIAIFRFRRRPASLARHPFKTYVAVLSLAATLLPSGLVVAWTQPGPTGQGLRGSKVRYAAYQLGQDNHDSDA